VIDAIAADDGAVNHFSIAVDRLPCWRKRRRRFPLARHLVGGAVGVS
jgi:hypothetical protein